MHTKQWKTEWDLSTLYASSEDPQIEKDLQEVEKALRAFITTYTKNTTYLTNPAVLKKLLDEDMAIGELPGANRPLRYLHLLKDAGKTSPEIEKKIVLISERMKKLSNETLGIFLALGKVSKAQQQLFLKAPELTDFNYYLTLFFERAKHQLTEAEEKILTLKSGPASSMWTSGVEKAISKKTVKLDGEDIQLGEAASKIPELPTKKRRAVYEQIINQALSLADYAEGEFNAIINNKKINDELRGFKNAYDTAFFEDEVRAQDILPFAQLVTDNADIAHRFYKLKKKLLGLETMKYCDRSAKIDTIKRSFTFKESATLLYKTLETVDPSFAKLFDDFLVNGQIDVFPKKRKRGGAYQSAGTNVPTMVLLNHVDTLDSLTTLAHEMGHAIHSHLAQTHQPLQYQGYSTAVAETASTFFENFIFEAILPTLSPKEQIIALHDKIEGSIATVFRQIAAFNFEIELHNKIRTEGFAEHQEIAALMKKHLGSYLGKAVSLEANDGYSFVLWPHFRSFFYVYTYAYGELISDALYARYKADKDTLPATLEIFKAGSSLPPHEIFARAGIDTTKTNFFMLGLQKIEEDIKKLEKLTK